jgi:uncharacterized protein YuzE
MTCAYDCHRDELLVCFVNSKDISDDQQERDLGDGVFARVDRQQRIVALRFPNASTAICKVNT